MTLGIIRKMPPLAHAMAGRPHVKENSPVYVYMPEAYMDDRQCFTVSGLNIRSFVSGQIPRK